MASGSIRMASSNKLQQHFIHAAQVHDGPVIALHELLDGKRISRVFVAEHFRQPRLVIEQQPVFTPPGQHVQTEADAPQELLALIENL